MQIMLYTYVYTYILYTYIIYMYILCIYAHIIRSIMAMQLYMCIACLSLYR